MFSQIWFSGQHTAETDCSRELSAVNGKALLICLACKISSDVLFEIWFLLTRLRYGKPEQGTRRFES